MIRPLTLLSLAAAAGAGMHLYGVKHEVAQLERQVREVVRETELVRERSAVLRAEWALLNEPERLRATAAAHLALEPMRAQQFARLGEAGRRLPEAVVFAGPPSLFALPEPGSDAPTILAAAIPAAREAGARPGPAPAPAPHPRPVSAQPAQDAAPDRATEPRSVARPAPARATEPRPTPRKAPPEHQLAEVRPPAPRPVAPRVAEAALYRTAMHTTPVGAPERPVLVGSVLGGASSGGSRPLLAPPVPVARAVASTLDGG